MIRLDRFEIGCVTCFLRKKQGKMKHDIWYISHPSQRGARTRFYSTGVTGGREEIRKFVEEKNIEVLASAAKAKAFDEVLFDKLRGGTSITVREAIEEWLVYLRNRGKSPRTVYTYESKVKQWIREAKMGDKAVRSVEAGDITPWVNKAGTKINTRHVKLESVRSLITFCRNRGYIMRDPAMEAAVCKDDLPHRLKESTPRKTIPWSDVAATIGRIIIGIEHNREEIRRARKRSKWLSPDRLIARLRRLQFWRFAMLISYDLGLRFTDVARLEWGMFTIPGKIVIYPEKTGKRLEIPLPERIQRLLERDIPVMDKQFLFPKEAEEVQTALGSASLRSSFGMVRRKYGTPLMKERGFHSFRHSCLTRWKKQGLSLEEIARRAGHGDTKVTEIYIHEDEET